MEFHSSHGGSVRGAPARQIAASEKNRTLALIATILFGQVGLLVGSLGQPSPTDRAAMISRQYRDADAGLKQQCQAN